jgi:hypothetical protein
MCLAFPKDQGYIYLRVIRASIVYKPLHARYDILSGGYKFGISLIVRQHDHVLLAEAVHGNQKALDVMHIVDTT